MKKTVLMKLAIVALAAVFAFAAAACTDTNKNGNTNNNNTNTNTTQTATDPAPHEHSWTWVLTTVTVVDQEAWDEEITREIYWCPLCDKEVNNKDHAIERGGDHSVVIKEVLDHTIHHDAVTHDETQGHYECSECGEWQ